MAVYAVRAPDGVIVWYNRHAPELWGRAPVIGDTEERFCGAHKLFYPDGSRMGHSQTPVALALSKDISVHNDEIIIERPDKSRVHVSVHAFPLRDENEKIVGVVNCCYDITEQKTRTAVLRQAREELERKVEERTASLRDLSSHLMNAQDDERRHISRELHDSVGQQLAAAKMYLGQLMNRLPLDEAMQRLAGELYTTLDGAITQLRTVSYLLHPPMLDEMGFRAAVCWYAEGFSKRSGIAVDVHIPPNLPRLSEEKETALFRVVQESLTNVHRHSGARKAAIRVTLHANLLQLEIADAGKGVVNLDVATPQGEAPILGVGIRGMRERLRELHGNLEIRDNNPGTRIIAAVPLSRAASAGTVY